MSGKRTTRASRQKTDRSNRKRMAKLTDAQIARAAKSDPDSFVPDAKWFSAARLVVPEAKRMVTLRLDPDVLTWFRKTGRGYQTRINAVLRAFVEAQLSAGR
jgi:uncharacterized protein (DUF4415 family)